MQGHHWLSFRWHMRALERLIKRHMRLRLLSMDFNRQQKQVRLLLWSSKYPINYIKIQKFQYIYDIQINLRNLFWLCRVQDKHVFSTSACTNQSSNSTLWSNCLTTLFLTVFFKSFINFLKSQCLICKVNRHWVRLLSELRLDIFPNFHLWSFMKMIKHTILSLLRTW